MSQLQTGTTASQGGSTTRHTIFMLPCLLHKWTEFACKTDTTLTAVSRHIEKLCLIRPWDLCRKETPPEARRLHDLFEEHVFFHAPAYTLTRLAQEVLDVVCEVDAECWVLNAFNAWQEHHTALVDRPQSCRLSSAASLDILQGSQTDIAHTVAAPAASSSASEEEEVHFADCLASVELQIPVVFSVDDVSRPICNFVSHALRILTPGLENTITPITVLCKRGLKDLYTLPREAQERFANVVGNEFPRGEKLCGVVLDLIVNKNN